MLNITQRKSRDTANKKELRRIPYKKSYQQFLGLIRWHEWWYSKIQPQFIFVYIQIYYRLQDKNYSAKTAYITLLLLLTSGCAIACYGYLINNYFDQSIDKIAGKQRLLTTWMRKHITIIFIGIILSGIAPLLFVENTKLLLALLLLNIIIATCYSSPPLRFKEKAIWGIVCGSAAQRAVPTIFVNIGFVNFNVLYTQTNHQVVITGAIWTFIIGLRWMLIHQLLDEENDRLSNVTTFVTKYGSDISKKIIKKYILPIELFFLFYLLLILHESLPYFIIWIASALIIYIFVIIVRFIRFKHRNVNERKLPFYCHAPDSFYEILLPLGMALLLALKNVLFIGFLIIHIAMFQNRIINLALDLRWLLQRRLTSIRGNK